MSSYIEDSKAKSTTRSNWTTNRPTRPWEWPRGHDKEALGCDHSPWSMTKAPGA